MDKQASQEGKIRFMEWFSAEVDKRPDVKPHHMSAIQAFLKYDLGLSDQESPETFKEAMRLFGYGE